MRDEKGEYEPAVGLNHCFTERICAYKVKRKDGTKTKTYDSWHQKN